MSEYGSLSVPAVHEAGHAVVAAVLRVPFRYVTLRPRSKGISGHVYGITRGAQEDYDMLLLAGVAAELIHEQDGASLRDRLLTTASSDFAALYACHGDRQLWAAVEVAFVSLRHLFDDHWDQVVDVALVLERRRTLTCQEVRAVMNASSSLQAARGDACA